MANPNGNPQNLKVPTSKQARKNGSKGGKKSAEVKKQRKTLKEELLLLLSEGDVQERMSLALINEAINGNSAGSVVRAFEAIQAAIGEKPRDELEIGNLDDKPLEFMDMSKLTDEQLKAILLKK